MLKIYNPVLVNIVTNNAYKGEVVGRYQIVENERDLAWC